MNHPSRIALISVFGCSLLAGGPLLAQTMPRETFELIDIDGDSGIDGVEFGAVMGVAFAHADENADGILSAEEVETLSLPAEVDANGDTQVTLEEYLASVRGDFRAADLDEDGTLSP